MLNKIRVLVGVSPGYMAPIKCDTTIAGTASRSLLNAGTEGGMVPVPFFILIIFWIFTIAALKR
jgi:hypothetical protein